MSSAEWQTEPAESRLRPGLAALQGTAATAAIGRAAVGRGAGEQVNLDVLRAVAVSLVVLNHLGPPNGLSGVAALGHLGVLLFFVHTCLVLLMSMERGGGLFTSFFIRRAFRIYPLSILSIAAVVAIGFAPGPWSWGTVTSNLLLIQNLTGDASINGVLWSLPFELQMYAVLPLIFVLLRWDKGVRGAVWAWVVAAAAAITESLLRPEGSLLLRYAPCFVGGVVAWRALRTPARRWPAWSWAVWLGALIVAYRAIWTLRGFGLSFRFTNYTPHWPVWVDVSIEGLVCLVLGLSIPQFRQISNRWMARASKLTAQYSYGIYLSHSAAIWLCYSRWNAGGRVWNAADSIALTVLISVICYHAIEKPFIDLGKRLAR